MNEQEFMQSKLTPEKALAIKSFLIRGSDDFQTLLIITIINKVFMEAMLKNSTVQEAVDEANAEMKKINEEVKR